MHLQLFRFCKSAELKNRGRKSVCQISNHERDMNHSVRKGCVIGHFFEILFYHHLFSYPNGFYGPMVFMPDIIDFIPNDLELRIIFSVRGFGPPCGFPSGSVDVHLHSPGLPIFHGIGLLTNIINLASYDLKLRKGLIILTRGLLFCLPARPIDIHFRSEDLSKRTIVLMPDIVNPIS